MNILYLYIDTSSSTWKDKTYLFFQDRFTRHTYTSEDIFVRHIHNFLRHIGCLTVYVLWHSKNKNVCLFIYVFSIYLTYMSFLFFFICLVYMSWNRSNQIVFLTHGVLWIYLINMSSRTNLEYMSCRYVFVTEYVLDICLFDISWLKI